MALSNIPIIDVRGLSHTYLPGTQLEVRSLTNVDFQLYRGETVGIIGPTGSGKSTLLQHLNGLMRPQEGEVLIMGLSLSDPSTNIRTIRQRIGLVFQNPEDQLFERYAGDDVAFGPRNLQLSHEEVRKRVRDAMAMVGLPFAYKDRLIAQLSVGEKRRLAIAGVLAMDPEVLVLDEPAASLDPAGRRELFNIIAQWQAIKGRAAVIVSHNMEDIVELCSRLYVLVEGKILLQGSVKEVFSHSPILVKNGLSIPVPAMVMHELLKNGYNVSPNALTIEEAAKEIEGLFDVQKI